MQRTYIGAAAAAALAWVWFLARGRARGVVKRPQRSRPLDGPSA